MTIAQDIDCEIPEIPDNVNAVVYHWVLRILEGSKREWHKFVRLNNEHSVPIVQGFMFYFLSHGLGHCNKDIKLAITYGEEAREWILAEAYNGNQYAQFLLAEMYLRGHVMLLDEDKAFEFFHRSADRRCELAFAELAKLYFHGVGCERDRSVSIYWHGQASLCAGGRAAGVDFYCQHSKGKVDILMGLVRGCLLGVQDCHDDLSRCVSTDFHCCTVPLSTNTDSVYEQTELEVRHLLRDPLAEGFSALLAHHEDGGGKRSRAKVQLHLSRCSEELVQLVQGADVHQKAAACFLLGYFCMQGLKVSADTVVASKSARELEANRAFTLFSQSVSLANMPLAECHLGKFILYSCTIQQVYCTAVCTDCTTLYCYYCM